MLVNNMTAGEKNNVGSIWTLFRKTGDEIEDLTEFRRILPCSNPMTPEMFRRIGFYCSVILQ
jgi:hypothetical protein